jgi:hypothetical protein
MSAKNKVLKKELDEVNKSILKQHELVEKMKASGKQTKALDKEKTTRLKLINKRMSLMNKLNKE